MHLVEGQARRLADQLLEGGRVQQARHLHEDAVAALADDLRLRGAREVHPPAHRLYCRADGVGDALLQPGLGRRDDDHAAFLAHFEVAAGEAANEVSGLLGERAQLLEGCVAVLGLGKAHLHGIVGDADARDGDLGVAQALARIVTQRLEPVLAHLRRLHGQQQMGAAAQVQPQIDLRPGEEPRPVRHGLLGEETGDHEDDAQDDAQDDGDLFPADEMQHRSSRIWI